MKKHYFSILFLLILRSAIGQEPKDAQLVLDPDFGRMIDSYLEFSVPVISCPNLYQNQGQFIILDARESQEYQVSHLKDAFNIGYNNFNLHKLDSIDREKPVVVYCSIGYRSEKIATKLKQNGFSKVYNLYGSIFEWANRGYPLYNQEGEEIKKIHTYNKKWSRWVEAQDIEKVW